MLSADFPNPFSPFLPILRGRRNIPHNILWAHSATQRLPLRGRFPYQGKCPEGTKGVGTLSPKVTERLSQIWYDLSVSAFRRATSPRKGEALDFRTAMASPMNANQ